jgi:hypothetical protein
MLTVEKIGGTSMTKFQDVLQNIIIGPCRDGYYYNRIFIVSATIMSQIGWNTKQKCLDLPEICR